MIRANPVNEFVLKREKACYDAQFLGTAPDILGWIGRLARDREYITLSAILTLTLQERSAPMVLKRMKDAAEEALCRAGEEAVPEIHYALEKASNGRKELAEVLLNIGSDKSIPVLCRYLERGEFSAYSGLNDRIFRFAHDGREPKEVILAILRSDLPPEEKQPHLERKLTAAGHLCQGLSLAYCDCGFPIRLKYSDGSEGLIREILDKTRSQDFVVDLSCPHCKRQLGQYGI